MKVGAKKYPIIQSKPVFLKNNSVSFCAKDTHDFSTTENFCKDKNSDKKPKKIFNVVKSLFDNAFSKIRKPKKYITQKTVGLQRTGKALDKGVLEQFEFEDMIRARVNKIGTNNIGIFFDDSKIPYIADEGFEVYENLTGAGIEISKEDVIDIIEFGNYFIYPEMIVNNISGKGKVKNNYAKAMILIQLQKEGKLNDDVMREICGVSGAIGCNFLINFEANDKNYFLQTLKKCGIEDEKSEIISKVAENAVDIKLSAGVLKSVVADIQELSCEDIKKRIFGGSIEELTADYLARYKKLFNPNGVEFAQIKKTFDSIDEMFEDEMLTLLSLCQMNQTLKNTEKLLKDDFYSQLNKKGLISVKKLCAIASLSQEQIEQLKEYLSDRNILMGFDTNNILWLVEMAEGGRDCAIKLIADDSVVDYQDAVSISDSDEIKKAYFELISLGYDKKLASVLVNISDMQKYDIDNLVTLINSIDGAKKKKTNVSSVISSFLQSNKKLDVADFAKYLETIDHDELKILAPALNEYSPIKFLTFLNYHYREATKDFSAESLEFNPDFTKFLMQNYLNADQLTELLIAYPNTKREVGELPVGWLDNITSADYSQAYVDVYKAITEFQKSEKVAELARTLSEILKKEVKVDILDAGLHGQGFRISTKGAPDVCLKIYNQKGKEYTDHRNIHGQHVEVQVGLFANNYSDKFVKMYFGRVSDNYSDDGFLVTQFLSDEITPESTFYLSEVDKYKIKSVDTLRQHNMINGKIIDFGAVEILKDNRVISKWY